MSVLPNRPSDLIELALADLEKCEANPRYRIEMEHWHYPVTSELCEVCLAGSVIAQTLGVDPKKNGNVLYTDELQFTLGDSDRKKLIALDWFRTGGVCSGLEKMGLELPVEAQDLVVRIEPYELDPQQFKADLKELAHSLREAGL